jgi:hypothetical protein
MCKGGNRSKERMRENNLRRERKRGRNEELEKK